MFAEIADMVMEQHVELPEGQLEDVQIEAFESYIEAYSLPLLADKEAM